MWCNAPESISQTPQYQKWLTLANLAIVFKLKKWKITINTIKMCSLELYKDIGRYRRINIPQKAPTILRCSHLFTYLLNVTSLTNGNPRGKKNPREQIIIMKTITHIRENKYSTNSGKELCRKFTDSARDSLSGPDTSPTGNKPSDSLAFLH